MALPARAAVRTEARRTVEVGIAELAATRRTDEHLARMAEFVERMRDAHRHTDVPRFVEADLAFHDTLFEAVDNVFLAALCAPLSSVLRTLRHETSSVPQIREHAIDWHAKILASVADADPDAAREMMRGHLIQTEDDTDHFLTGGSSTKYSRPDGDQRANERKATE